jgi:Ca2+-binding EF-hand superfamily protein
MTRTCLLAASLLAAAFAAAPSFAQDTSAPAGKPDRELRRRAAFDRIDANRDGFIDRNESRRKREAPFDRRDVDKDGRLSLEEFTASRSPRGRAGTRGGSVNAQPGTAAPMTPAASARVERATRQFHRLDTDKDGYVSRAEWTAVDTARFNRCDVNKDDRLAFDECKLAQASRRRPTTTTR